MFNIDEFFINLTYEIINNIVKKILLAFFLVSVFSGMFAQSNPALKELFQGKEEYDEQKSALYKQAWPDVKAELAADIAFHEKLAAQIHALETDDFSADDKINYDFIKLVVDDKLYLSKNGAHYMPLTSEGGFITGIYYNFNGKNLSTDERKNNYLKKLSNLPNYIQRKQVLLQEGLKKNITVPKLIAEKAVSLFEGHVSVEPEESFLLGPLKTLKEKDIEFSKQCQNLVSKSIYPAITQFNQFLNEEYIPKTRSQIGVSENIGGKAFYEQRVRFFTTLDMSPKEVFQTGQKEVARIRTEMLEIIAELGFEGSFADFLAFLRTDPQFYPKTAEELLYHAAWISKKAEAILPKYFSKLPRNPFTVNPVPKSIEANYTTGRYSPGSIKNQKAGEYWVNTYNLPSRKNYLLAALTLHEAVPGHHLQGSLAQELENVPALRNNTYLSAFGEGWALYCEYLGKEAGIYTSPYEHFGRLSYEMWRACRLVVDPGMHYMGWTREQALAFMASNTALSLHEVNTEIDRYIGWPGQAVSYKIGELKIRELRTRAEQKLGNDFDIRSFHDLILANGSIPLNTLENIVENYIADKLKTEE